MSFPERYYAEADFHAANFYSRGQLLFPGSKPIVGRDWFVHGDLGSAHYDGRSAASPRATIASVFSELRSGDRIFVAGNIREQVVSPVGVFDVSVIGMGNRPRHGDAHTGEGGYRASATWRAPSSGETAAALLRIQQQGWTVQNICFQLGATSAYGVEIYKTDDSGDGERDGAHLILSGCKIQGTGPGGVGLRVSGGMGFLGIYNNVFLNCATGIGSGAGGGGTQGWWEVIGNRFSDNTNGMVAPLVKGLVKGNTFLPAQTVDLSLASGSGNVVTDNIFMGDYDACVAGTGDLWFNNYALDAASDEVAADGKTTAVPAA